MFTSFKAVAGGAVEMRETAFTKLGDTLSRALSIFPLASVITGAVTFLVGRLDARKKQQFFAHALSVVATAAARSGNPNDAAGVLNELASALTLNLAAVIEARRAAPGEVGLPIDTLVAEHVKLVLETLAHDQVRITTFLLDTLPILSSCAGGFARR